MYRIFLGNFFWDTHKGRSAMGLGSFREAFFWDTNEFFGNFETFWNFNFF
jgi:hypothetical protein